MNKELLKRVKAKLKNTFEYSGGTGYRWSHVLRVMRYCEKMINYSSLKGYKINKKALLTAALMHDIEKEFNNGELVFDDNHALKGAETAKKILRELNYDEPFIKEVAEIISEHNKTTDKIEVKILQDADDLDEIGNLNLWRMFSYNSLKNFDIEHCINYWLSIEIKREDEWLKRFRFEETREIAKLRINRMKQTMSDLIKEYKGEDIEEFIKLRINKL